MIIHDDSWLFMIVYMFSSWPLMIIHDYLRLLMITGEYSIPMIILFLIVYIMIYWHYTYIYIHYMLYIGICIVMLVLDDLKHLKGFWHLPRTQQSSIFNSTYDNCVYTIVHLWRFSNTFSACTVNSMIVFPTGPNPPTTCIVPGHSEWSPQQEMVACCHTYHRLSNTWWEQFR